MSLGVWDVAGMLSAMSPEDLDGWIAYAQLEPFGDDRADLRNGLLACAVETLVRGEDSTWKPGDFMPFADLDDNAGDDEYDYHAQIERVHAIVDRHNASLRG